MNETKIIKVNFSGLWYFLAFFLYLLPLDNGFIGAFFTAFLGRFYVAYFLIKHHKLLMEFCENITGAF